MTAIETWGGAILGARENQEDWFAILPLEGKARVGLVVADGMGGHVSGETASRLAGETFAAALAGAAPGEIGDDLVNALGEGNRALADAIAADPGLDGMGTTLVGAVLAGERVSWISVGDSLLLLVRNGAVSRLNADHSLGAHMDEQIRLGRASPAEAPTRAQRNQLLSAVSGESIELVEVAANAVRLEPMDVVVAASDGLLTLDLDTLGRIVGEHADAPLPEIGAAILAAVVDRQASRQDNATVVLARVGDGADAAGPKP